MSRKTAKLTKHNPTTALCYIRLSWTRDAKDTESPDRQRSNILRVCEQNGWLPEFYEDAEGHKSGTTEKNRPGWLALKSRLADPDIAALVANDLSRLHRKGWRIGDLLDFVDEHEVKLVLAAQGKQIDFSTPLGRLMVQVGALFDEWYAQDIGQRSRDNIQYRKSEGKTIGIPPFGTKRDDKGFLIPTNDGAWLLPDGTFVKGKTGEEPPVENAVWRGFHAAAHRVLELYSSGTIGIDKLAYQMQEEGWSYRNRQGEPIPFESDDIRRIVSNWPEYDGHVSLLRAKERHPHKYPLENYVLNPDRAVFPVDLLYKVGKARYDRTLARTIDDGHFRGIHPYPLLGLVYCHHCDVLAKMAKDPKRRTRLGGKNKTQDGRYRHKHGVKCGSTNRSIKRDILEADFGRLLELLWVNPEQIEAMTLLNLRALGGKHSMQSKEALEAEKRAAIAKCTRKIEAARHLFEDGDISREEYVRRKEQNEREIAHWNARTTETDRVALELTLCQEAIARVGQMWNSGNDDDKQGLVRSLFEEIVLNLDTQRITSFKLKPWADNFISLRAALYQDEGQSGGNKTALESNQGLGKAVTPTGSNRSRSCHSGSLGIDRSPKTAACDLYRTHASSNIGVNFRWKHMLIWTEGGQGNSEGILELRDWDTLEFVREIPLSISGQIQSAAFSFDGRWLALADDEEAVYLTDFASGEIIAQISGGEWTASVQFAPSSEKLATACSFQGGGHVVIYRVSDREIKRLHTFGRSDHTTPANQFVDTLGDIAFSPDSRFLVLFETSRIYHELYPAGWRGNLALYSVDNGTLQWENPIDAAVTSDVRSLAEAGYSSGFLTKVVFLNADVIACGSTAGGILLYDTASGKLNQRIRVHPDASVISLALESAGAAIWVLLSNGDLVSVSYSSVVS